MEQVLEMLDPSEKRDLIRLNFINYIVKLTSDSESQGLVGDWNFDEGEGTVAHDRSGNANNGTIRGAKWVKGHTGYGLEFDGSSDVDCGVDPSLYFNSALTIEAWLKWTGS